jgi:hypothetical protein
MPAPDYAHSLRGLTINLLVRDVSRAMLFQREVLRATVVYSDPDFAVVRGYGGEWMIHADHAYEGHPAQNALTRAPQRGAGIELRLHGCDPDEAEMAALRTGFKVLAGATTKAHGLREVFIMDGDGYIWVPDVPK